jgi:hypothetical protein
MAEKTICNTTSRKIPGVRSFYVNVYYNPHGHGGIGYGAWRLDRRASINADFAGCAIYRIKVTLK